MTAAVEAGAHMINDVSALTYDARSRRSRPPSMFRSC